MTARNRPTVRLLASLVGVATSVLLVGCTAAPATPTPTSTTSAVGETPAGTPSTGSLTIDITIADKLVSPSGEKIDATVGQTVVLNVTSDSADEIHAHTGGDGYELEVPAGKPTTGSFVITDPGSFEIESHHLEKTIVILNAR